MFTQGKLTIFLNNLMFSGHMISSEIFHESGEQFSEEIKRNEGVFTYYLRHLYLVAGVYV
jgi:hypothetical protein